MSEQRTHRSYVSYIDKTRIYYAAQGYAEPYQWVYNRYVPFNLLSKPLSDCTVGVVTTSTLPVHWQNLHKEQLNPEKKPYAESSYPVPKFMYTRDLEWDKHTTHTDDLDTFLPLNRLHEFQKSGIIGKLSHRFYGAPTTYSQRQTREYDAPAILSWCEEDGVDIAILVPL